MRISIMPKSLLGWLSVGLVVASFAFFVLFQVILGPGPDYNMTLAYVLTAVTTGIAVAAFVTGLISVIKNKERSILVFVAMVISFYSLRDRFTTWFTEVTNSDTKPHKLIGIKLMY